MLIAMPYTICSAQRLIVVYAKIILTAMPASAPARTPRSGLPVIRLIRKPVSEPMAAIPSIPMLTSPALWEYSSARERKISGEAILTLARIRFDINDPIFTPPSALYARTGS